MAHPSDMAPVLVALKARAIIASSDGEREVSLEDCFLGPNNFSETVLESNEFLIGVRVPNQNGRAYQVFLKHRIRHAADFALSSVATVAQISNGIWEEISIIVGGVAPFPYRASMAEDIVKRKRLDERLILRAAEASVEGAHPLPMNHYKVDLTKALVRRALTSIWDEAQKS